MRNEEFGRLLSGAINSIATYEGATAPVVEASLGEMIGLSPATVQRYKRGHLPPDPRTIQLLSEAAVKRGFLDRRWLTRFLHTAAYPAPDALLDGLCPRTFIGPEAARVLQNLPPPSYAQFITRPRPFAELLEALGQRTAVVVVASLGGMGKTSLVREVAAQCLTAEGDLPRFDAAVWVSDAERPGTTTLAGVLDEIARTLQSDGLVERAPDEKRRGVELLLRGRRVLVIIDNFETVTDTSLLLWLLKLPEPSKAIITTREYRREYRHGAWPVELRGMIEAEARAFLGQRLRLLRLDAAMLPDIAAAQLITATGGNPKALTMALGGLKYARRPVQDIVEDVAAARGELFDDLLERSWSLLDESARRVLLAATLFAPSADRRAGRHRRRACVGHGPGDRAAGRSVAAGRARG
jgi:transcriptional regulator with XRE-family HTH domain